MTLRHVVAWRLATADPAQRAEQAAEITSRLTALRDAVPAVLDLYAGPDVVAGGNWDVALVADFDDRDALQQYIDHPDHQQVASYIRSVIAERAAVDFEL